ncbi:MAG: cysteine desulfurase [Candidatus Moranbacteria bacterium CG_4_9_14_3_um_filter_42_9]|nr:MAG: cysteine desulfurase [Candidatus Moranbacteria bacterium CG_4_9_14_3_um_filter_42_9]
MSKLDVAKIRADFPILNRIVEGHPLVYFDNAATSQKPKQVIEAITEYYSLHNANVHRGIHTLSEEASNLYEQTRQKVADFIGAASPEEIVFTKGTTEGINLLADTLGRAVVSKGDIILTTELEHHSNLVPWQQLAKAKGAHLEYVEIDRNGNLDLDDFSKKIVPGVKIVAIAHISNVLGTILPLKVIADYAHKVGVYVIVDGAQAVPHLDVNVNRLGCDAYVFSAHKMLGPTGVGVLWTKQEILSKIEPYQFGGGMIESVYKDHSTWAAIPAKFEAGTPNIEGVVAFGAAIDYLEEVGMEAIREHESELTGYAFESLQKVNGLKIFGPMDIDKRGGLMSFTIKNLHPHDIAAVLNNEGIAVRSGHHCAMPLHLKLGVSATVRASFYLYNDKDEVDKLVAGLEKARQILG